MSVPMFSLNKMNMLYYSMTFAYLSTAINKSKDTSPSSTHFQPKP